MGPIMSELRDGREHRTGRSKKSRQTIFRGRNTISISHNQENQTYLSLLNLPHLDPHNHQPMRHIRVQIEPPSLYPTSLPKRTSPWPPIHIILPIILTQIPILLLSSPLQPTGSTPNHLGCFFVFPKGIVQVCQEEQVKFLVKMVLEGVG